MKFNKKPLICSILPVTAYRRKNAQPRASSHLPKTQMSPRLDTANSCAFHTTCIFPDWAPNMASHQMTQRQSSFFSAPVFRWWRPIKGHRCLWANAAVVKLSGCSFVLLRREREVALSQAAASNNSWDKLLNFFLCKWQIEIRVTKGWISSCGVPPQPVCGKWKWDLNTGIVRSPVKALVDTTWGATAALGKLWSSSTRSDIFYSATLWWDIKVTEAGIIKNKNSNSPTRLRRKTGVGYWGIIKGAVCPSSRSLRPHTGHFGLHTPSSLQHTTSQHKQP